MFIYSLRASTLKFFAVVCVALAALITLIAFIPAYGSDGNFVASASKDMEIKYDGGERGNAGDDPGGIRQDLYRLQRDSAPSGTGPVQVQKEERHAVYI
mgnify:CR=1 FL=1